ncbi:MAG: hypothetical protein ACOCWG_03990 [bacterium]
MSTKGIKGKELLIYPYHGIYGIETQEQLIEALKTMGITEGKDPSEREGNEETHNGARTNDLPYLVHYYFYKPNEYASFSKSMFDELENRSTINYDYYKWKYIRHYKKHISIGYSLGCRYKCISLQEAKRIVKSREERLNQKLNNRKKQFKDLPKTIRIILPKYKYSYIGKSAYGTIFAYPIEDGTFESEEILKRAMKYDKDLIVFVTNKGCYWKEKNEYKTFWKGGSIYDINTLKRYQFNKVTPGKKWNGIYKLTGRDIRKELGSERCLKPRYTYIQRIEIESSVWENMLENELGYY